MGILRSRAPEAAPPGAVRRIGFGGRVGRWDAKFSPYLYISPFFVLFIVTGLFPIG
ncbi:MAG: sugar ABC transporter permease, partial [Cellulomonadaceae bacterium]|nr:sugar ABC transporter permease [Cellulomonadaceae bacterium]